MEQTKVIEMYAVSFGYDTDRIILEDIKFCAYECESIGLIGANGMGKSTLLKLLTGIQTPTQGEIHIDGIKLEKSSLKKIRRQIGYMFQDSENQLFMSRVQDDVAFGPKNMGITGEELEYRVSHALEVTGAEYLRKRQIYKLSGGEKKLVSIASVLSMDPKLLLLDEPTIALDPRNRKHLIGVLNSFSALKIIASHDLDMILDTCERCIVIDGKRAVYDGPTEPVMRNEEFLQAHGLELPLRFTIKTG